MTAASRIAVIDDDEDVHDALTSTFASAGSDVVGYPDAESFLASETRPPAACVVSDVQMPGMGGLEWAGRLRSRWPHVPMVLITAFADDAMRWRAGKAGVPSPAVKVPPMRQEPAQLHDQRNTGRERGGCRTEWIARSSLRRGDVPDGAAGTLFHPRRTLRQRRRGRRDHRSGPLGRWVDRFGGWIGRPMVAG